MEKIMELFKFMSENGVNNMTVWKKAIEKDVDCDTWSKLEDQGYYIHTNNNGLVYSIEDPYTGKWIDFY